MVLGRAGHLATTSFALPPRITVMVRVKNWANGFAMFLLREVIPNRNMCASNFLKVIVALILNGCFQNIKGNRMNE